MAHMYPRYASYAQFLRGEGPIFEHLGLLPSDYLIFHDRNLHPPRTYNPRVHHIDFLVLRPRYGVLLLAVERGVIRPLEGRLLRVEADGSARPIDPHRRLREAAEDLIAALASWGFQPLPIRGVVLLPDTDPRVLTGSIDGAVFAGEVEQLDALLPTLFDAQEQPPQLWLDGIVPALTKVTDGYGEPAPVPPPPSAPATPTPTPANHAWMPPVGGAAMSFDDDARPPSSSPAAAAMPEPPRVRPPRPAPPPESDGARSGHSPVLGVTFLGDAAEVAALEGGARRPSRETSTREIRAALRHRNPGSRQTKYRRTRFMNTDPELFRLRSEVELLLTNAYAVPARAREAVERRLVKGHDPRRVPIVMMNAPRDFGAPARGTTRIDFPKLEAALLQLAGRRRELEREAKRLFPMTIAT